MRHLRIPKICLGTAAMGLEYGTFVKNKKPSKINKDSQWLGGIGAGSWFSIKEEGEKYRIERFSKQGELEFSGIFKTKSTFKINRPYKITYLSHFKFCKRLSQ